MLTCLEISDMRRYNEFEDYDVLKEGEVQPIDYSALFHKVLKGWKQMLLFAAAGLAFGVMVSLSVPRSFTSKALIAPELVTRATSGGLSSLASLAGINVNNMTLTDAMHPDMYPSIINSTAFYLGLFDMPVTVETKDSTVHTDLYNYILTYTRQPWWNYVIGLPFMAKDLVFKSFKKKDDPDDAEGYEEMNPLHLTRQQEMVVRSLSKCITSTLEKRTYLLSITVTTQDPVVSSDLANTVVKKLGEFVVSYRTEKSRENVEYFQGLYQETREEYLKAQRLLGNYMDSHQNIISKGTLVYQQQLQNEAQLRYQMYSQTAQNLLNAEAKVQQESPVLVVIQPGVAPRIGRPSRVKTTLLWTIIGGIFGVVWFLYKTNKTGKKEEE